jgi:hypothetical protein
MSKAVARPGPGPSGFLDGFSDHSGGQHAAAATHVFGSGGAVLRKDTTQQIVRLVAEDGGRARGYHYHLGGERTAVAIMHPRADCSSHYLVPTLLEAGYAAFGVQGRYFNNDEDCLHEALLADISAAIRFVREFGYEKVVLLGNSGGGSLFTFYQAMAETAPPNRPTHTPGGTPYDLNTLELPGADGLLLLAAHLGEGVYLMNCLDPSVTDESDPLSCDPRLDMYDAANGFRPPPETSTYSPEFIARYRAAQVERCRRIDATARQHIADNRRFRAVLEQAGPDLPDDQRILLERRAAVGHYMLIARTDANPASTDLSLYPSQRRVGSLLGPRPDLQNYRHGYFAHCMTPEGWLSTWSGLSSRAAVLTNIEAVTVPTIVINYSADAGIYPPEAEAAYQASGAADKLVEHIDAEHYGTGTGGTGTGGTETAAGGTGGSKEAASDHVIAWLTERFPVAR